MQWNFLQFSAKTILYFSIKRMYISMSINFFSCLSSCKSSIKWNFPFALFYSNVYLPLYCNERSWFFLYMYCPHPLKNSLMFLLTGVVCRVYYCINVSWFYDKNAFSIIPAVLFMHIWRHLKDKIFIYFFF